MSQTQKAQTVDPRQVVILPDPITQELEGYTVTISFFLPPDAGRRAKELRATTAEALRGKP